MPDVADLRVKVSLDGEEQVARGLQQANASVTSFASNAGKMGGALGGVAKDFAAFGVVAGGVVAAGLAKVVGTAADFEKGMSAVKAASGATAGEMAQLSAAALQLGADVQLAGIDATDAALAMSELAKGGVTVSQQLGGATKGALLLASAGAISVGEAAGIATKAMNIFGLSGADVAHVADLMSAGANKSATDVGQLGAAFNQSAAVAKSAGLDIETLTGTLAFLAQRGMEGSDAGTSLKTALLALQAPTDKAAATMAELGINVRDAQGHMLPFADIADVLKSRLAGLSDAQRDAALKTIFGNDAIRVGIALYEGGGSAIRDWTAKVDDAGSAARTGATLNDNLKGSLDQLGATVQTAAISFGTKLIPVVRTATDGLAKFVDQAMKSPEAQHAIEGFATAASGALQAFFQKVQDPAFQAGAKALGTAFLDVGKAVADFAGKVAGVVGPVLEAAGLLFGALDSTGQRNVVMFGLVAGAALRYRDALTTLGSVVSGTIKAFAAKEAAKASLTKANDALAGSAGRTALSFGTVGTAAGVAGALLIPLAIFAGNVANDMNAADAATKKVAQSLSGDLAPAIGKIQATNWEEALVATFAGHARAAEDAGKAVHDWANGIGGAIPTLGQLQTQLDINTAALANNAGASSAENNARLQVSKALYEEIAARTEINRVSAIRDAYLTSEAQAQDIATAAARAATLAASGMGTAFGTAAVAMGATATAATGMGNALAVGARGFGIIASAAASATPPIAASGLAFGAFATAIAGAQGVVSGYDKEIAGLGGEFGHLGGYLGILQGEWDRLNVATDNGKNVTAAQAARYAELAPLIEYLNAQQGVYRDRTVAAAEAGVKAMQVLDGVTAAAGKGAAQQADYAASLQNSAGTTHAAADAATIASIKYNEFGQAVGTVPPTVTVDTSAAQTAAVIAGIKYNEFGQAIKDLPPSATTTVTTNAAAALTDVNQFGDQVRKLPETHTTKINVELDTKLIASGIDSAMAEATGMIGGGGASSAAVTIQVKADTSQATTAISTVTADLNTYAKLAPTPIVAITDNATGPIAGVKDFIGTYGAITATATAALLDNASGPLGGLIGTINSVPRVIGITASVDISGALGAIQQLRDNMPHSPAKEGPFRVLPDWTTVFDTFGTGVDGSIAALGRLGAATDSATADLQSKIAGAASAVAKAITDTLGALSALSSFDFAKNSPSGATLGWFSFLTTSLVATIVDAAAAFKSDALKAAGEFADAAGKVSGFIKNALDAFQALSTYDFAKGSPTGSALGWFRYLVESLVATMEQAAALFKADGLKAVGDFADAANKVTGMVKGALDAFAGLSKYTAIPVAAIYAFGKTLKAIVNDFAVMAEQVTQPLADEAAKFAEAAGKVVAMIGGGVDAFTKLATYVAPPVAAIYAFGKTLRAVVNDFAVLSEQITVVMYTEAAAFAEGAGKVVGMIGSGVEAFTKLADYQAPAADAIYAFGKTLRAVINDFALLAEQITQDATDQAAKFATGAGAVVGIIGGAVEGFTKLLTFVAPSQAAIDNFIYAVYETVRKIAEMASQMSKDGIKVAGDFGVAAGSVLSALKTGLDVFTGMAKLVVPSRQAINDFAAGVAATVAQLGVVADQIGKDGIKKAADFGASIQTVFGSLKTSMDLLTSLAKFKDTATKAFDSLLAGMQEAVQRAQGMVDQAKIIKLQSEEYAALMAQATVNFAKGLGVSGSPQEIGRRLGEGVISGAREAVGAHSPAEELAKVGRDITAGLVMGMTQTQQDAVKAAADLAKGVADAIQATLGAATALGKLDLTTLPTSGQITGLLAFTRALVAEMAASATLLSEDGAKATTLFADTASKVASAVSAGVDALGKLATAVLPTPGAVYAFGATLGLAVTDLAVLSERVTQQMADQAATFAEAATKAVGVYGVGADAFGKLRGYAQIGSASIYAFGKDLLLALGDLAAITDLLGQGLADKAGAFGEQVGKATGGIVNAVAGFVALKDYVRVPADALYAFGKDLRLLVQDFAAIVDLVGAEMVTKAAQLGEGVGKVTGGLASAVAGFKALLDFRAPTDAAIAALTASVGVLLRGIADAAKGMTSEGLKLAGDFADAGGKAVAIIGNAVSGFVGLATFVTPGRAAVDGLIATIRYVIARFGEMATTMSTEGVAQTGAFGAATQQVLGGVKSAIDTFIALDKAVVPRTGDLSDLVVAVQGVTRNMAAAAAELGDKAIADATAFGTAAQGIFTALKSGLDLFIQIDKPGQWPVTDWLQPLIELMSGVLSRGGLLLTQAQQLESIAAQFAASVGRAMAGFGSGWAMAAGGALPAGGDLATGSGLIPVSSGGGGGGQQVNITVVVSGNTVLGDDYATGAKLAAIIAPELRRLLGV